MSKTELNIDLNTTVSQTPGHIVSDMNGEKVMLSVANGKYYNLGAIGGDIWGYIQKPITIDSLVNNLLTKYEVSKLDCQEQVESFLRVLKKEGLINIE